MALVVLEEGGPDDRLSLRLETRRHRHIPNITRRQLAAVIARTRAEENLKIDPRIQLLSSATTYNCYGLALASRRTCILSDDDIPWVLADDEYRDLPWDPVSWRPGDLALYTTDGGDISHVAVLVTIRHDLEAGSSEVFAISAWGETGEYLHPLCTVSPWLGRPFRVVSQRCLYDS